MTALTKYDQAKRALAEVRTATQAKDLHDKAAALLAYAKAAMDTDLAFWAAEIKLRSERKLGQILIEMEKAPGRPGKNGRAARPFPTLKELKLSKDVSARSQRSGKLADREFESFISECKLNDVIPTTALLLGSRGRRNKMAVHHSSKSNEHYTPKEVIELVQACFGGAIDLDPCSNSDKKPNVPAITHYTKRHNGLAQLWLGNVFVNPPYGDELLAWVEKCITEHQEGRTTAIILLVPSRTDTAWWRALRAFPRCHWSGRLKFVGNDDSAPFPSTLFWISEQPADIFAATLADHGDTFTLYPQQTS